MKRIRGHPGRHPGRLPAEAETVAVQRGVSGAWFQSRGVRALGPALPNEDGHVFVSLSPRYSTGARITTGICLLVRC